MPAIGAMANGDARVTDPILMIANKPLCNSLRRSTPIAISRYPDVPLPTRLWTCGPAIAWMALIFYLSSQSDPAPAVTSLIWDKGLHGGGYAVLGLLFARAWRAEGKSVWTAAVLAAVCASLYGASDEVHQIFTPMRQADVRDWVADTAGGTFG